MENKESNEEDNILRPDIHSQLNELLLPRHENAPTSLLVDNMLSTAYQSNDAEPIHAPTDQNLNKQGPLSLLYNKPYSISPNNIYQSIVITQLSDKIESKDDVDIQVIYPNELHLIATGKSLSDCSNFNDSLQSRTRSKSISTMNTTNKTTTQTTRTTTTTTTVTKIELDDPDELVITQTFEKDNNAELKSIECQTDVHMDPLASDSSFHHHHSRNNVCTPSMAETESISFYCIDEAERLRQLDSMLTDNYYTQSTNNSDPCLEFEAYLRGRTSNGSNSNPICTPADSRSRANSSPPPAVTVSVNRPRSETAGTQTFLCSVPDPEHKSAQTSPELLRKYLTSNFCMCSPLESPADESKSDFIKTRTDAIIQTSNDKINESFKIRNRSKSGEGVQYAQISEYKTDLVSRSQVKVSDAPIIQIHESIVLTQDEESENENENEKEKLFPKDQSQQTNERSDSTDSQTRKKLGHSTIEITQVTDNATTVTGLSMHGNAADRFSMSVNMPSSTPLVSSQQPAAPAPISVESKDQKKQLNLLVLPNLTVPIQTEYGNSEAEARSVNKTPIPLPKQPNVKEVPNVTVSPNRAEDPVASLRKTPPPLPKSMPNSFNAYPEEIYDNKISSKRKPIIIECNDPKLKQLEKKIVLENVQPLPTPVLAPTPVTAPPLPIVQNINTIHKQLVKPPPVVNRADLPITIKTRLNAGGFQQPQPKPQIKPTISRRSILTSSSSSIVSIDDFPKAPKSPDSVTQQPLTIPRKSSVATLSESSKISFNRSDPGIIDINFDVYDENEGQNDETDNDEINLTQDESITSSPIPKLSDLNNNNLDIDFSVYDEEPRVLVPSPSQAPLLPSSYSSSSPTVYSAQPILAKQQLPPSVPVKARQFPSKLSNSSVNLNTNFANQQKGSLISNNTNNNNNTNLSPRKLFSDWQNLIENVEPQNVSINTIDKKYNDFKNINNDKIFQSNLSLNIEQLKQKQKLQQQEQQQQQQYTVGRRGMSAASSTVSGLTDTGVEADIEEETNHLNRPNYIQKHQQQPKLIQLDKIMPPTNQFNQRLPQSTKPTVQPVTLTAGHSQKPQPRRDIKAEPIQLSKSNQVSQSQPVSTTTPEQSGRLVVVDSEPNITSDLNLIQNLRSKFKTNQIVQSGSNVQQQQSTAATETTLDSTEIPLNFNKNNTIKKTVLNVVPMSSSNSKLKSIQPTPPPTLPPPPPPSSNNIPQNNSRENTISSTTQLATPASSSSSNKNIINLNNNNNNTINTNEHYSSLYSLNKINNPLSLLTQETVKKKEKNEKEPGRAQFKQSNNSLDLTLNNDSISNSNNSSSRSKMYKIMNSTAEKEYQKLLRRIEKRRIRVPQILEQLKTCRNSKERKKLEEELRVLMRKSERDNLLLSRYLAANQSITSQNESQLLPLSSPRNTKSEEEEEEEDDDEEEEEKNKKLKPRTINRIENIAKSETNLESASMTSFSTTHSKMNLNSASCNSLLNDQTKNAAGANSAVGKTMTKQKTRAMARESGYSSCGDESAGEHVSKLNSCENLDEEQSDEIQYEQQQPKGSSMKSAIKSSVVDKILIDSSDFIKPKPTNLRITKQPQPLFPRQVHQQKQTDFLANHDLNELTRQSSKLDDLMIEVPQIDMLVPAEISINSSGSDLRRQLSTRTIEDRFDIDAENDRLNPNNRERPQRHNLFPGSGSSSSQYSGRAVPMGSTSSAGSGSYRALPAHTANTGRANNASSRQQPQTQQQPQATESASSINISPIGDNVQSTASSSLIRPPSEPNVAQLTSIDDFTVEYVSESSLGDNYMQTYQVEQDPATGQVYIVNYLKKIKYVIVPDALLPDENNNFTNNNSKNDSSTVDQTNQPERIIDYVEEADLDESVISSARLIQDPFTGESIIFNENNPVQQWIILPVNWREADSDLPYLAREDIDMTGLDVYIEPKTRRKYIIDEKTGNKYFLVTSHGMAQEFKEKWAYFSQLKPKQQQQENSRKASVHSNQSNSSTLAPTTTGPSSPTSTNTNTNTNNSLNEDSAYVDEKTLREIDLIDANIEEDPNTGEVIVYHSADPNTRWVVLPNDWQLNEDSNYVDEEDLNLLEWDVFVDPASKRRYVIDEKTGQRFFIVKNQVDEFKKRWNLLVDKQRQANKPQVAYPNFNPNSGRHISFDPNEPMSDNGLTERFENEPSNFKLRSSLKNSPERDNNLNLKKFGSSLKPSPAEQTKLIIKQPGKMGHSVKSPATKSKSKSPATATAKRTLQQQNILRAQQEAARRAFLNQKMPGVGELWIHQMLLDNQRKITDLKSRLSHSTDPRNYEDEEMSRNRKHWKSLNYLNDPTMDAESAMLDRNRLADVQINGYNKYDKSIQSRQKIDYNEDTYNAYWKDLDTAANSKSKIGFGGGENTFVRGVLTEDFKRDHEYYIKQMNSRYRALVPRETNRLRQQFLLTPRYLKDSWEDTLGQSYKLKPRIILINDNERILTANKNCNVYVQFDYDNDSVKGANPMYQFMLPDCGPVAPTRPLLITPGKIDKLSQKLIPPCHQVDVALRDAPVYVYHRDGSAFFENIAQYLAGRYPQLSPQTARKILQFADMKEFEDYLASKITREEAKRISELSGSDLINVETIRNEIIKSVDPNAVLPNVNNNKNSVFYHKNCEYDPLRNMENNENLNSMGRSVDQENKAIAKQSNETHEIRVGGRQIKSTFIGFKPTGQVEQLKYEDLPQDVRRALQQMPQLEQKFFADSKRKRLIPKI